MSTYAAILVLMASFLKAVHLLVCSSFSLQDPHLLAFLLPPWLFSLSLLQIPFPGLSLNVIPLNLVGEFSSLHMCFLGDLTFSLVSSLICTWYLSLQDLLLCSPVMSTSFHNLLQSLASLPWVVTQPHAQVNKPEIQAVVFGALPPYVLPRPSHHPISTGAL